MPTRMIDGDALWRSDKLAQIKPPSFRAEYANLIPLALADGTFECNHKRVWADVYSYNRPDISLEIVEKILDEFERVGLLRRKTDASGKIWGFWVGIESRLPSESTRNRYIQGKANIFNGVDKVTILSRPHHDDIVPGLVLDRIGLDRTGEKSSAKADFQKLRSVYREIIGKSCSNASKYETWYFKICKEYDEGDVLCACRLWAEENTWRDKKPDLYFFFSDVSRYIEAAINDRKMKSSSASLEKENAEKMQGEIQESIRIAVSQRHAELAVWEEQQKKEQAVIEELKANPNVF